jgi:putative ABC transport system permease protein
MNFFSVVTRGLLRRPVRTGLTLGGIAISIAAVVALVGTARGFDKSWDKGMQARGVDVVVSNMGTALVPKPFDAAVLDRIKGLPHVGETSGLLVELISVETADMMMVSAREWGSFAWENVKVVEGRLPKDANEKVAVLGTTAAELLHKKVGDPLQIETQELTVVGIVDGGAWVENGSVIVALPVMQEITGNQGKISVIDIRAKEGSTQDDIHEMQAEIDKVVPEGKAMLASGHVTNSQGFKMIKAMTWGTSLMAVLVGILGVMNTMLMAVFERTREICILLALGWKKRRIVGMILAESALLGLLGGIAGVILGVGGALLLQTAPTVRGMLEPDLGIELLGQSILISMAVGVLSGIYPAWRSSRLMPSGALAG